MRVVSKAFLSALLLALVAALPAQASDYGVGIDLVRLLDQNQDDDGLMNAWVQFSTIGNGALLLGYADGDNIEVVDVAYKHYMGERLNSVYFQAGLSHYDGPGDDDVGFVGAVGFERKLAKHFAIGGSVKLIAGVDENLLGTRETPVFQPTLSVAVPF